MKVLIIDDEQELRSLLAEIVESSRPGATVWTASSLREAKEVIFANQDLDLLVVDENLTDGKGSELVVWFEQEKLNFRYVLCSTAAASEIPVLANYPVWGEIRKPNIVEPLIRLLEKLDAEMLSGQESLVHAPENSFSPIHLATLMEVYTLPSDVYVRLAENKFVRVLSGGDLFGEDQYRKYHEKNMNVLYVRREVLVQVLEQLSAAVQSVLQAKTVNPKDEVNLANAFQETIQRHFHSLGLSSEVSKAVKEQMQLSVRLISQSVKLKNFLQRFKVDRDSYLSAHSVALGQTAGSLLAMMPWRSEQGTFKLAMAAILHDIALNNNELAELQTLEAFELAEKFTKLDKAAMLEHPIAAADLARQLEQMPPDVDTILVQHHERADGSGFPHALSAIRISPLSALFIMAHDILTRMTKDPKFDARQFLMEERPEYGSGSFRRIHKDARAFIEKTRPIASS